MAAVFPNFHNGRYAKCLKRDSGMGVGWGVFSRAPPLCERGGDVIDRSSISIGCHSSARRRGERERERDVLQTCECGDGTRKEGIDTRKGSEREGEKTGEVEKPEKM